MIWLAVARKDADKQTERTAAGNPGQALPRNELDDAVTTELSDVLRRAFDEDWTADPGQARVLDAQLSVRIDPADDGALDPGFVLKDRFEIVELLHSGGMGHVYKAIDLRRHPSGSGVVHVAIKMMRSSIASRKDARFALEREAAKAQALSHPNIINIFDFDEHDGQFFLVMEWLEGESVNALLRRMNGQCVTPSVAWPVIEGAAAALQHAHANDVVHADVNPSNIFITENQGIKLLDFGVARFASAGTASLDGRMTWVTQTYSSPEVLSGLAATRDDDVFSLGCIAYRLLSGRHPFDGSPSLVAKHKQMSAEPISGLAEDDWYVLRRALAYDRSGRPASVGEFVRQGRKAEIVENVDGGLEGRASALFRTPWVIIAALAVLIGGWFFTQAGRDVGIGRVTEPTIAEEAEVAGPIEAPNVSPIDELILAGAQAVKAGRLVLPEENNARSLYRNALELEPDNVHALRELRGISDDFVRQAHLALNVDDPAQAYAALAIAAETDPQNPAIAFVEQLLAAKGNSELANARLAATAGDLEMAEERLVRAERYSQIENVEIQAVRQQIALSRTDSRLLARLGEADAHLVGGRLISPSENNAHALLLALNGAYEGDARLVASMERLGERLLTRAAFAAAAARKKEAISLLDAAAALGVLTPEVESARAALASLVEASATEKLSEPNSAAGPDAVSGNETRAADEASGSGELVPQPGVESGTNGPELQAGRRTVREFGIENYVAPEYPRRAHRRGITGLVEVGFTIKVDGSLDSIEIVDAEPANVFSRSALEAVRQWRFAPRDEPVSARITLRFDMEP